MNNKKINNIKNIDNKENRRKITSFIRINSNIVENKTNHNKKNDIYNRVVIILLKIPILKTIILIKWLRLLKKQQNEK